MQKIFVVIFNNFPLDYSLSAKAFNNFTLNRAILKEKQKHSSWLGKKICKNLPWYFLFLIMHLWYR